MAKKILTVIVTVLLLAGVLFGVCYYVGWRANQISHNLQVLYDGVAVDNLVGLSTAYSAPLVFQVTGEDYTVKVVPATGAKITYLIDGQARKLADLTDLTAGFVIDAEDGIVTIKPRGSLETILSVVTGRSVTLPEESDLEQDLFTIVFAQGDTEYRASCGLYRFDVRGVELSEGRLVF